MLPAIAIAIAITIEDIASSPTCFAASSPLQNKLNLSMLPCKFGRCLTSNSTWGAWQFQLFQFPSFRTFWLGECGHWQIHPESAVPCARLTTNVESEECKKILEFQSTRNNVDFHGVFGFFSFFFSPFEGHLDWTWPWRWAWIQGGQGQRVNGSAHGTDCLNMFWTCLKPLSPWLLEICKATVQP